MLKDFILFTVGFILCGGIGFATFAIITVNRGSDKDE